MATSHIQADVSSRYGELFRAFWAGSVPAETTYDFVVRPPVGVRLIGISRSETVLDGRLDITFLVGGDSYTVAETMTGHNFNEETGRSPQASLQRVTGLSEATARSSGAPVIAPETGPIRTQSVQTINSAQPTFTNDEYPVFRYQNPGASPTQLWIDITWKEEPQT